MQVSHTLHNDLKRKKKKEKENRKEPTISPDPSEGAREDTYRIAGIAPASVHARIRRPTFRRVEAARVHARTYERGNA